MLKILFILLCGYLLFELIEHAVLPLAGLVTKKNRRSSTGQSGMIGQVAEVKEWTGNKGKVFVHGELWQAESDVRMNRGDKAIVLSIKGLKLKVKPLDE